MTLREACDRLRYACNNSLVSTPAVFTKERDSDGPRACKTRYFQTREGQLIGRPLATKRPDILSRARYTRNRSESALLSIEHPPETVQRGGESFDRHFRCAEKTRGCALTIFYREYRARPPPSGTRYGFRHIIRDFFPVPGEIGGICRRVFGGTSERISVDLDRAVSLVITYGCD